MATKDSLDIGTSINVIDGVERGSAYTLTTTSSFFIDGTNTPSFTANKNLLDGCQDTTLNIVEGTPYYVKLTAPIFVNFLTLRTTGMTPKVLRAWYSASDSTTPPSAWTALNNGVLNSGDTPQYAYRFLHPTETTAFAVCWIKFTVSTS